MSGLPAIRNRKSRQAYQDYLAFGGDLQKMLIFYADHPTPPARNLGSLKRLAKRHRWSERAEAAHEVPPVPTDVGGPDLLGSPPQEDLTLSSTRVDQLACMFRVVKNRTLMLMEHSDGDGGLKALPALIGQLRGLLADIAREITQDTPGQGSGGVDAGGNTINLGLFTPAVLANRQLFSDEELSQLMGLLKKASEPSLLKEKELEQQWLPGILPIPKERR